MSQSGPLCIQGFYPFGLYTFAFLPFPNPKLEITLRKLGVAQQSFCLTKSASLRYVTNEL